MDFRKVGSDKIGTVFTNFGNCIHNNNTTCWGNHNREKSLTFTKDLTIQ
jgi:hypothetical protein